jgi:hypothetical protein
VLVLQRVGNIVGYGHVGQRRVGRIASHEQHAEILVVHADGQRSLVALQDRRKIEAEVHQPNATSSRRLLSTRWLW